MRSRCRRCSSRWKPPRSRPPRPSALPALGKQVDALAASVTGKGLAAYFPRELRDLDDAREKLGLCAAAAGCATVRLSRRVRNFAPIGIV